MKRAKTFFTYMISAIILACPLKSFAQEENLNTYYTSPFGSYDRLRLVPREKLADVGETCSPAGLMYVEEVSGDINFCRDADNDGEGVWGHLSGVWTKMDISSAVGDDEYYIYPVSTSEEDESDPSTVLQFGIGTATPFPSAEETKNNRLHIHVPSEMDWVNFDDAGAAESASATKNMYEEAHVLFTTSDDVNVRLVGTDDSSGLASIKLVEVDPVNGLFQNRWVIESYANRADSQLTFNFYDSTDTGWDGYTPNYGRMVFSKEGALGIGKLQNNTLSVAPYYNPILAELHIQRDDGEAALRLQEMLNAPDIIYDFRVIDGSPDRLSLTGGYAGSEDTERFTLNTDGDFGIAQSNPQAKVHVDGNASLKIESDDNAIVLDDPNGDARIKSRSDHYLEFSKFLPIDSSWEETLKFFYDSTPVKEKQRFKAGFGMVEENVDAGRIEPEATFDVMSDGAIAIRPGPCSGSCSPSITANNIRGADFQIKLDDSKLQILSNYVANGTYPTLYSGASFNIPLMTIDYNYKVGFWTSDIADTNALQIGTTGSACYVTKTGVWGDASSREFKTDIQPLDDRQALEAFMELEPVTFKFKTEPDAKKTVGFIAEDVPALVAVNSRKALNTLDFTALLTSSVKQLNKRLIEQKALIDAQKEEIRNLEKKLKALNLL